MTLIEFLKTERWSVAEFGRQIDITPSYLSNIIHGRSNAGSKLRKKVYTRTKGKVGLEDWPLPMRYRVVNFKEENKQDYKDGVEHYEY